MKNVIAIVVLAVVMLSLFSGIVAEEVEADENYNDHSQEISPGPGESPDDGMDRVEPRTRNKDAWWGIPHPSLFLIVYFMYQNINQFVFFYIWKPRVHYQLFRRGCCLQSRHQYPASGSRTKIL